MSESLRQHINDLPEWTQWAAQDSDGTWWGFETEPNIGTISWYENEVGQVVRLTREIPNPQWRSTLVSLKELQTNVA